MEINTYYGRCACCLSFGYLKNMWEEHYWEGNKEIYAEMLVNCFGLSWDHSDDSKKRKKICEICIKKLRGANDFKKTVLYSLSQLQFIDQDDFVTDFENCNNYVEDTKTIEFVEVEYLEEEDEEEFFHLYESPESNHSISLCNETQIENSQPITLYTQEDLDTCVRAVINGDLKLKDASVKYNIPISTITAQKRITAIKVEKHTQESREVSRLGSENASNDNGTISKKKLLRCNRVMYRQYTNKDFEECMAAIKNKKMSHKSASIKYNIPISTINKYCYKKRDSKDETDVSQKLENFHKRRVYEFKIKNNVRNILKYSNATPLKGYWGMGYGCAYCSYQNSSPAALKTHTLQTHSGLFEAFNVTVSFLDMMIKLDITGLECLICSEEFSLLDSLMVHLKSIHDIEIHLNLEQNNIVPFKFDTEQLSCALCEKPFEHFKYLIEHMTEHFRNYECDICGRGFVYEKSLNIHKPRHQLGDFKCSFCDKVFKNKLNAKAHERILHMKCSRTRKCNFCPEMFMDSTQRSKHEVSVHGVEIPSYDCKACNKTFFSILALKTHTKRFHLLLKPHKCDICGKGFYYKYGLFKHQVKHTGDKRYQCDICEKWYTSRSTLMGHMKIHMGDKRYKCDICEQAFVQKCGLLVHLKSKHDVKCNT